MSNPPSAPDGAPDEPADSPDDARPMDPDVRTVLIVEDHPDTAATLAEYLTATGRFRAVVAPDGEAGVAAARRDRPDAVLCDLGLPRKGGLTVARELSRLPDRPLLIAVTGSSDEATRTMARRAGFDHFLVKPADPAVIERLVAGHDRDALPG
jgi:DNA-binding response OmpR family regulator